MSFFSDILTSLFERAPLLRGAMTDDDKPIEVLCRDLLSSRGEVSGMSLAQLVLDRYADFDDDQKLALFTLLANEMDVSCGDAVSALRTYESTPTAANYAALTKLVEPARLQLIRRLNQTQYATTQLVAMRHDLLRLLDKQPELAKLDIDFKNLFTTWFNRGFLVLRPINWGSPAHILEKIISYESVHAIQSWDDLRRRLQPDDRRCFAFFHPRMPEEPLIFVQVALVNGLAANVDILLDQAAPITDPKNADTAIFYSISNTQSGLGGISFGGFLIKRVVDLLKSEFPALKTFATLSPIPGFRHWLVENLKTGKFNLSDTELKDLKSIAELEDPGKAIGKLLDTANWYKDESLANTLQPIIMRAGAEYLAKAKRTDGVRAANSVANFHLMNGARIERLNWLGDTSKNGLKQSSGLMVNYLYDLERIETNHECYSITGKTALSSSVKRLLKNRPAVKDFPKNLID